MGGKTVVVTGGSRGLGFSIAEGFLSAGAEVMITGRDPHSLSDARARLLDTSRQVSVFAGDATDPDDVAHLADAARSQWPAVDVLVNNAGLYESAPFLDCDLALWNRALAANLTGPFLVAQSLGRWMVECGRGSIVNVASTVAHGADGPWTAYSAAKAGLLMLTKSIATELGPSGVRCNSISPGYIDSDQLRSDCSEALYEYLRTRFARLPLRRLVSTAEVVAACVFLGSDSASGITGIDLRIDGGALADSHIAATFPG